MAYSQAKLEYAISVYREASLKDPQPQPERHLRNDYSLRQVKTTRIGHVAAYHDTESSADEYDPKTPNRRRSTGNGAKQTPKRPESGTVVAEQTPTLPDPSTILPEEGLEQCDPGNIVKKDRVHIGVEVVDSIASFVTLTFNNKKSKAKLDELAKKHGKESATNPHIYGGLFMDKGGFRIAAQLPPHEQERWHLQYLEKLDVESAKVDNWDGRALRNRKIPDRDWQFERCAACKADHARCSMKNGGMSPCTRCQKKGITCVQRSTDVKQTVKANASGPGQKAANEAKGSKTSLQPSTKANAAAPILSVPTLPTDGQSIVKDTPALHATPASSANAKQWTPKSQPSPKPTPPQEVDWSGTKRACQIIRSIVAAEQYSFTPQIGESKANPIVIFSPPASPTLSSGDDGLLRIKTCWAHPIDFKHVPSLGKPCHFCSDFRYGIHGYGPLDVEVIQYPDTVGFEETGDGHRSKGKEATRMCIYCGLARLYISRCQKHRFRKTEASTSPELHALYTKQVLAEDWNPPLQRGAFPTCSLCQYPAAWSCCADQKEDQYRQKLTPTAGKDKGCGLLVCNRCHFRVIMDGGVLKKETLAPPGDDEVRADIDFLFLGSEMHQAYGKSRLSIKASLSKR